MERGLKLEEYGCERYSHYHHGKKYFKEGKPCL